MRHTKLLSATAIAVFVSLAGAVFLSAGMYARLLDTPQVATVVTAVLTDLTNADRAQLGLSPLTVNPVLTAAAQAKADDMVAKGYFSHTSPEGVDPWHWFQVAGYEFSYAGENLAVDFSDSADVNAAWMASPTHRENILDPHYTEVGIALAQGMYQGRLTTFVVQEFGTPGTATARSTTVPEVPTEIATAEPSAQARVLGSAVEVTASAVPEPVPTPEPSVPVAESVAPTPPAATPASPIASAAPQPAWAPLVAHPRAAAESAFYAIALLILLALIIETGLEFRLHHRTHLIRAGAALAVVALVLGVATIAFFPPPVIAAGLG